MSKTKTAKNKTSRTKPLPKNSQQTNSFNLSKPAQNIIYLLFALSIALTPLVSYFFRSYIGSGGPNNQSFYGYTPDLYMAAWIQVSTALMLIVVTVLFWLNNTVKLHRSALLYSLIAFVVWASLSMNWSLNNYESLDKLSNWWGGLAGMLILLQITNNMKQLKWLFALIFISGLMASLMGIAQYLWGWSAVSQAAPPASSFGNKNFAAQFCLMCLPLGWLLFFSEVSSTNTTPVKTDKDNTSQILPNISQTFSIWFFALSTAIIMVYIVYTSARAAWISVTVQIIIVTVWVFKESKAGALSLNKTQTQAMIVSLFILVSMIHFDRNGFNPNTVMNVVDRAQTVVDQADIDSGNKRIPMWTNTLAQIKANWLKGVGIGNWYIHYPLYQQVIVKDQLLNSSVATRHTHNDLLQLVAELGVVGFVFIVLSALFSLLIVIRLMRHDSITVRIMTIMMTSALVGIIVDSQFSSPLQRQMTCYLLVLFLGVLVWLDTNNDTLDSHNKKQWVAVPIPTLVAISLVIASVALSYKAVNHYQSYLKANQYYWIAKTGNRQKDYASTYRYGYEAYKANPARKRLLNLVGGAQLLLKNYPEAIQALEEARASYPYMQHTLLNLSHAYEKNKQFDKAIDMMQILHETQPMNASHLIRIGKLYNKLGNIEQTSKAFSQALEKQDVQPKHRRLVGKYFKQLDSK